MLAWRMEPFGSVSGKTYLTASIVSKIFRKPAEPGKNINKLIPKLKFTMNDGSVRPLEVASIGDTGFHLSTDLYHGGLDGKYHGSWRGQFYLDGEYFNLVCGWAPS
jgi:hypothetical protein